jgi:hypothetical protein
VIKWLKEESESQAACISGERYGGFNIVLMAGFIKQRLKGEMKKLPITTFKLQSGL